MPLPCACRRPKSHLSCSCCPGLLCTTWPVPRSFPRSPPRWVLGGGLGGAQARLPKNGGKETDLGAPSRWVCLPSPAHGPFSDPSAWLRFNRFQPESSCVSPVCLAAVRQAPRSALPALAGIPPRQPPALGSLPRCTSSPRRDPPWRPPPGAPRTQPQTSRGSVLP